MILLFAVNAKNMTKFTQAFHKRTDIVPNLKEGLKCDALVVVGTKSMHIRAAEYMHSNMDKVRINTLFLFGIVIICVYILYINCIFKL